MNQVYISPKIILRVMFAVIFISITAVANDKSAPPIGEEEKAWAEVENENYIRDWLICGEFPNPPHADQEYYDHSPPCIGLETDYLAEHDGEINIQPVAGMSHKRPDGTTAAWFEYASPRDAIDFIEIFEERSIINSVAYAYANIEAKTAGQAILVLGSDDGVRIWLNGEQVHDHLIARPVRKDEDTVPVSLKKGTNRLLVKVEQGAGGWGLVLRVLGKEGGLALKAREDLRRRLSRFQFCELGPTRNRGYMVSPGRFPEIGWQDPQLVERLIGQFPLSVRWFNNDLEEVQSPEAPGRYLAYVEGKSPTGLFIRRGLTVYCRPDDWRPWRTPINAYIESPFMQDIDSEALSENRETIASSTGAILRDALLNEESGAILMSFLDEMKPTGEPSTPAETPKILNNDRHLALKMKLLGMADKAESLQLPKQVDQKTPELKKGSEKDAAMKDGTVERLHQVCKNWYEETELPFVTLIARRGVVFYHEAFGENLEGKVALDQSFYLASITKAITGMMFAQLIEQGIAEIDDPVGKFLPEFPTEGDKAITFRHCFTHTTGLEGHYRWGGVHNPWLDNVIFNGLDYLELEKNHQYNGMGYDLAGKAMEMATGKSIMRLIYENFFDPLGLTNSTIDDLGTATRGSAEDVAKIGQLLLNKGTYGDQMFFSAETFEELLPTQLSAYFPEINAEWGIGLTWMRERHPQAGKDDFPADETLLSKNTIGHGAASGSILRVDLDNELVVVQVRDNYGETYQKHLVQFLKTIDEAVQ